MSVNKILNYRVPDDAKLKSLHFCTCKDLVNFALTSRANYAFTAGAAPEVANQHTLYDDWGYDCSTQQEVMRMQHLFQHSFQFPHDPQSALVIKLPKDPQFDSLKVFEVSDRTLCNPPMNADRDRENGRSVSEALMRIKELPSVKKLRVRSCTADEKSMEHILKCSPQLQAIEMQNGVPDRLARLCLQYAVTKLSVHNGVYIDNAGRCYPGYYIGKNMSCGSHHVPSRLTWSLPDVVDYRHIQKLILIGLRDIRENETRAIGLQLQNLKEIKIVSCSFEVRSGRSLYSLLDQPKLRSVDLALTSWFPNIGNALGPKLSLEQILLQETTGMDDQELEPLLTTQLKHLKLHNLFAITDQPLKRVGPELVNLQHLEIMSCYHVGQVGLRSLFHPSLTCVTLSDECPLDDHIVTYLLKNSPGLEIVSFDTYIGVLTDVALDALRLAPRLVQLSIDTSGEKKGVLKVSEEGIQRFVRKWSLIRDERRRLHFASPHIEDFELNLRLFLKGEEDIFFLSQNQDSDENSDLE